MTKSDLIATISVIADINFTSAEKLLNLIFGTMKQALLRGGTDRATRLRLVQREGSRRLRGPQPQDG